jgi:hypothetical protein
MHNTFSQSCTTTRQPIQKKHQKNKNEHLSTNNTPPSHHTTTPYRGKMIQFTAHDHAIGFVVPQIQLVRAAQIHGDFGLPRCFLARRVQRVKGTLVPQMKGQALGKGQLFDALDGAAHVFPKQMTHDVGGIDAKRHFWKITTTVQKKHTREKEVRQFKHANHQPVWSHFGKTPHTLTPPHKHPYH